MAAEKPLTAAELREGIRLITARVQVISHITTATDQGREDHFRALGALIGRAGDLGSDDPWLARNALRRLRETAETPEGDAATSDRFVHEFEHPLAADHHHDPEAGGTEYVPLPSDVPVTYDRDRGGRLYSWHDHQPEDPS